MPTSRSATRTSSPTPTPSLRRVCALCELPFDPAMLSFHERSADRLAELGDLDAEGRRAARSGDERLAAHSLAREPATTARVGGWREAMSAADRDEFEAVAGDLLRELGYDAYEPSPSRRETRLRTAIRAISRTRLALLWRLIWLSTTHCECSATAACAAAPSRPPRRRSSSASGAPARRCCG